MGRAKGFRLQAGFGIHLQRGVPGHKQGLPGHTQRGGAWPQAGVAWPHAAGGCLSTSRTHSSTCGSLPVHKSYNLNPFVGTSVLPPGQSSVFALLWSDLCPSPTPGPAPTVRLVPQSRARLCPSPAPKRAPTVRFVPQSRARLCPSPAPKRAPTVRLVPPVPHRNPCAQACTPTLLTPASPILPLLGFL